VSVWAHCTDTMARWHDGIMACAYVKVYLAGFYENFSYAQLRERLDTEEKYFDCLVLPATVAVF